MSDNLSPWDAEEFAEDVVRCRSSADLQLLLQKEWETEPHEGRQEVVMSAVARYSDVLDMEWVQKLCAEGYQWALAGNEHLSKEGAAYLARLSCASLETKEEMKRSSISVACSALQKLGERGFLDDLPDVAERVEGAWANPSSKDVRFYRRDITKILLQIASLPAEKVERIARSDENILSLACKHPQAGPSLWRYAMEIEGTHCIAIAQQAAARKIPEVRASLKAWGESPSYHRVLYFLALDGREDFAELLRALWKITPSLAAKALQDAPEEGRRNLTREDLIPFLTSEHQAFRLAGVSALGAVVKSTEQTLSQDVGGHNKSSERSSWSR